MAEFILAFQESISLPAMPDSNSVVEIWQYMVSLLLIGLGYLYVKDQLMRKRELERSKTLEDNLVVTNKERLQESKEHSRELHIIATKVTVVIENNTDSMKQLTEESKATRAMIDNILNSRRK